jgi:hypothetical protein
LPTISPKEEQLVSLAW